MPANIQEEGNQMSQGSLTYDIVGSATAYTVEPLTGQDHGKEQERQAVFSIITFIFQKVPPQPSQWLM